MKNKGLSYGNHVASVKYGMGKRQETIHRWVTTDEDERGQGGTKTPF
jgi:hypothetical protein